MTMPAGVEGFVCPLCRGPLERRPGSYFCQAHRREFRIIQGIPDFRVFPDPYISFEAEEAKAARLAAEAPRRTFAGLIEFYYSITPEVPPDLVVKYAGHMASGVARGAGALESIQRHAPGARMLDLGCGTGGLTVAAVRSGRRVVGVDIALRWLVVGRKRLEEAGVEAPLVCACAEHLPFRDASFDAVAALSLIEHTRTPAEALREAHRVLEPAGVFFLITPNRLSLAPEPHVKVWGVGFLPAGWRARYVWRRKGVSYEHIRTFSFFEIRRMLRKAGFTGARIGPPDVQTGHIGSPSPWQRRLLPGYRLIQRAPVVNWLLYLFGPLLEAVCVKPAAVSRSSAGRDSSRW